MKTLSHAVCALLIGISVNAQVTDARNARVADSSKNNNRIVATVRTSSIPGIKKVKRGTALNSSLQVPVLGVDSNSTCYTSDPKIINIINQVVKNNIPVDVSFTPSKPCVNTDNCIILNTTVTEISEKENWYFEKTPNHDHGHQEMRVLAKLQPDKDYLVIIDQKTGYAGPNVKFIVTSNHLSGFTPGGQFLFLHGSSPVTFIIHTNTDYTFSNTGDESTYFKITPMGNAVGQPAFTYQIRFFSIRIKQLNL